MHYSGGGCWSWEELCLSWNSGYKWNLCICYLFCCEPKTALKSNVIFSKKSDAKEIHKHQMVKHKQELTGYVKWYITKFYKLETICLVHELWQFLFWDVNWSLALDFYIGFIVKVPNFQLPIFLPLLIFKNTYLFIFSFIRS